MKRALLLGLSLALAACKTDPVTLEFSGETMGTTYNITAVDKTAELQPEEVAAAIVAALDGVNSKMSNWDPNSEVSKFNASQSTAPVTISDEFGEVMQAAGEIHRLSDGQFDVTLGPLIELWGFGTRTPESPVPADDEIAAALDRVGQGDVLTLARDDKTLAKAFPDTSVYLAAIAKGYGVDSIAEVMRGFGLTDFLVEIGGDLYTAGNNPEGKGWRIGIERPDAASSDLQEIVEIGDLGMATSGDYRNYFEQDGVRYSHIIDAVTGRPIAHGTASVTVIAESAMMADGWATAMLALGAERGLPISEKLDLAVLFISRDSDANEVSFVTTPSPRFMELLADK
ncbi:MAG: FAD:protein FMN transferase [Pseudomonadota bacterium]